MGLIKTELWKKQYQVRDDYIKANLNDKAMAIYESKSIIQKICIVDSLQKKGFFEEGI